MSWLKMHLNWAMVFGWILAIGACCVIGMIYFLGVGIAISQGWMKPTSNPILTTGAVILLIAAIFLSIGVSRWACIQKGRRWVWAFLWLVPFGFIVLLMLKNKRVTSDLEGAPATLPPAIT